MTITRRRTDLMKGTYVRRTKDYIVLVSDYNSFGYYWAKDVEIDDEGNAVVVGEEFCVTPSDLIGGEI